MPEDPPLRRSVREFIKYYGLTRADYLAMRNRAKVTPRDWNSMLSASDEKALMLHIGVEKRNRQFVREIREQPRVTTQFVAPPLPVIDYETQIRQASDTLAKWRKTLVELAQGHAADREGRCTRCRAEAPCPTKRTLHRLDNELVEQTAVANSGDLVEAAQPDVDPARRVRELYADRDRWRIALVELTIDHMIEDGKGRCAHCPVGVPCDVGKAVRRINRGIAGQIEKYASMGDAALDAALGKPHLNDSYEDDWDVS